jgi:hypothetical protein
LTDNNTHNGHLFRDEQGRKLRASSFEPQFFDRLSEIQQTLPDLLSPTLEVEEEFGISRSF